jgi:hypothetical protein
MYIFDVSFYAKKSLKNLVGYFPSTCSPRKIPPEFHGAFPKKIK